MILGGILLFGILILSDIEMPQLDGWGLAEQVRGQERLAGIPLVAVTTRFSDEDRQKGKAVGFNIYLEKFKKEKCVFRID